MILPNLEALKKDLKSSPDRTLYLLLGPEQYQRQLGLEYIKNHLVPPEAAAFDSSIYSAKETPLDKIFETANTFPMLSDRRLVAVTELDKLAENQHEKFLKSLDLLLPRSMLVLVAGDLDRRKKLYKTIQDKGCVVEFRELKGKELARWVEAYAKERGYRISSGIAEKIVNLVGSDLQSLAGELEKVLLYKGKNAEIAEDALNDLVRDSRQHTIFELTDAIGMRNRAGALVLLAKLLGMGAEPLYIVTMLARNSRQVLIVKDCLQKGMPSRSIGSAAQIPPFLLEPFIRQARTMDLETVRKMHTGLHDIDKRLKSSSVDAQTLLEVFICALV